jgi:hypothetical protein
MAQEAQLAATLLQYASKRAAGASLWSMRERFVLAQALRSAFRSDDHAA